MPSSANIPAAEPSKFYWSYYEPLSKGAARQRAVDEASYKVVKILKKKPERVTDAEKAYVTALLADVQKPAMDIFALSDGNDTYPLDAWMMHGDHVWLFKPLLDHLKAIDDSFATSELPEDELSTASDGFRDGVEHILNAIVSDKDYEPYLAILGHEGAQQFICDAIGCEALVDVCEWPHTRGAELLLSLCQGEGAEGVGARLLSEFILLDGISGPVEAEQIDMLQVIHDGSRSVEPQLIDAFVSAVMKSAAEELRPAILQWARQYSSDVTIHGGSLANRLYAGIAQKGATANALSETEVKLSKRFAQTADLLLRSGVDVFAYPAYTDNFLVSLIRETECDMAIVELIRLGAPFTHRVDGKKLGEFADDGGDEVTGFYERFEKAYEAMFEAFEHDNPFLSERVIDNPSIKIVEAYDVPALTDDPYAVLHAFHGIGKLNEAFAPERWLGKEGAAKALEVIDELYPHEQRELARERTVLTQLARPEPHVWNVEHTTPIIAEARAVG